MSASYAGENRERESRDEGTGKSQWIRENKQRRRVMNEGKERMEGGRMETGEDHGKRECRKTGDCIPQPFRIKSLVQRGPTATHSATGQTAMSWVHVAEAKAVAEVATGSGEEDKGKEDKEGVQDMDTDEGNVGTAPATEENK